jgi:hypothetical protein
MAWLPDKAQDMLRRLSDQLYGAAEMFGRLDRYVDGQQHLRQLGLAIPPELERFTVIVNWPRVVAESRVDRLDLKGFRVGDNLKLADDAWDFWRSSGLDEDQTSYLDFEVFGRSFKTVENDETGLHIENVSPIDILAHRDPVTGRLDAALRRYRDVDDYDFMSTVGWRLYLPDRTYTINTNYQVRSVVENPLGIVPVVPAYRNPRTTIPLHKTWPRLRGTSALTDVIDLTDACARDLTNAQVAQETHAVPQRGVLGATKGDFVDDEGKPLTTWEAYFGRIWALGNPNAKTFEFSSSSMENFERMVNLYARLSSGVTGLPPNYFGLAADDAASADAIRSREAKLVKSIERDQRTLGRQAVQTCRLVAGLLRGEKAMSAFDDADALWYDAGTPTVAQRADAVTKLFATADPTGRPLMPREMAWEELGWGPEKIARAKKLLESDEEGWMQGYVKPEVPDGLRSDVADGGAKAGERSETAQQSSGRPAGGAMAA